MTEILFDRLKKRFLKIEGVSAAEFFMYGACERIHIDLFHRVFNAGKPPYIHPIEIGEIAKLVFDDVPIKFDPEGVEGSIITFNPPPFQEYVSNYDAHSIVLSPSFFWPHIAIRTGWRGRTELHERQRQKYLDFVVRINDRFIENAEKTIIS